MNTEKLNIDRVMQVMSEILSDKYGVKVTLTARRKEAAACSTKS